MEYNPRKMPVELQQQMVSAFKPMLHDIHFTRLDLAFDCDIDLGEYSHEHKNPMKRAEYFGTDGELKVFITVHVLRTFIRGPITKTATFRC